MAVESYSGYRFGQRPLAVWWRGKRWEVVEVVREWRSTAVTTAAGPERGLGQSPGQSIEEHFRVRLGPHEPGLLVELIYEHADDTWWLLVVGQR